MSSQSQQGGRRDDGEAVKVDANKFYGEYHGHKVNHLKVLYPIMRYTSDRIIWTAGDSSLDNKYWFSDIRPAVPGSAYERVLQPPRSNADITYWMNYLCSNSNNSSHRKKWATMNTAVEATTLNERTWLGLKPQDEFIRDNIRSNDILVVSIGGNDVALSPTPCTIASILGLVYCTPTYCLDSGINVCNIPINDCCCGCGFSLLNCVGSCPPCLGYLKHLFGIRVEKYIQRLVTKTKPHKVLVCMYYYPDETITPSWAGLALGALNYNVNPQKLQLMIRKAFVEATSNIHIPGTQVIPVPLFHALDGKTTNDYIARVEPSSQGGRKMAEFILDMIDQNSNNNGGGNGVGSTTPGISNYDTRYGSTTSTPLQATYMEDRG